MKKILLIFYLFLGAISIYAQGLENIIVEKYYKANAEDALASENAGDTNPLSVGAITYRIYADMYPGYRVIAVFWDQNHKCSIETSTSFYNSSAGGANPSFGRTTIDDDTNNLDSWVTMGSGTSVGTNQANWGIMKLDDGTANTIRFSVLKNDDAEIGIPLTERDGLYMTGGSGYPALGPIAPVAAFAIASNLENMLTDPETPIKKFEQGGDGDPFSAGSWYNAGSVGGGNPASFPVGNDNRVLIGQFTTNGDFKFKLNIQVASNADNSSIFYVWNNINDGYQFHVNRIFKSASLVYPQEKAAPVVSFISPDFNNSQLVNTPINIQVNATDPDDNKIDSVLFYYGNKKIGKVTAAPYQITWTTPDGNSFKGADTSCIIKAVAFDADTFATYAIDTLKVNRTVNSKQLAGDYLKVRIFPNPVDNFLNIEMVPQNAETYITLYSIHGIVLDKRTVAKSSTVSVVNVSKFPQGHYILEVVNGNNKTIRRFIKK